MTLTPRPIWSTPLDGIDTETSEVQVETEEAIDLLFAPYRPSVLVNPFDAPPSAHAPAESAHEEAPQAGPQRSRAKPLPPLNRSAHVSFLGRMLEPLPAAYVSMDSNRPWLIYWVLHSYDLLGAALDARGRARAISTLLSFQHQRGGFGGGPGQLAHLMSTYAAICAMAIAGGPGGPPAPEEVEPNAAYVSATSSSDKAGGGGWDAIDRVAMYDWLMRIKQPDGSFLVHEGGEVDVRGCYCVVTIATLLGILTPELVSGMSGFLASCQTYEGGLAAASQPTYLSNDLAYGQSGLSLPGLDWSPPRPALGEAHGGYAFCALASHFLLDCLPRVQTSNRSGSTPSLAATIEPSLDLDALARWATQQQGIPIEGGAFRGRTNKLVDGCYGWFSGGGMFAVLGASLDREAQRREYDAAAKSRTENGAHGKSATAQGTDGKHKNGGAPAGKADSDGWVSEEEDADIEDGVLFDRVALQEYVLIAAQAKGGGLRDKPGKRPDAYHTCYNLSGFSLSQHRLRHSREAVTAFRSRYLMPSLASESSSEEPASTSSASAGTDSSKEASAQETLEWRRECYVQALGWIEEAKYLRVVGEKSNWVTPTHPIFNITFPRTKMIMDHFYAQPGLLPPTPAPAPAPAPNAASG